MAWFFLMTGIIIMGVVGIKAAQHHQFESFTPLGHATYFLGFIVISLSFKHLSIGLAYTLWSGHGCLTVLAVGVLC